MESNRFAYRPDIDGLRALAVTAVVLYHADVPGLGGGFVGVDVFFVISGFLITQLLRAELARTGTIALREFYARRVRRLLPALLVVLLATIALWLLVVPGLGDPGKFTRSVRWSAAGLANLFFKRNTQGYFDGPTAEMPLLHLWSLGVEEQFYLAWPLLLLVAASAPVRRWIPRGSVVGLATLLTVASFLRAEDLIVRGPRNWAFYEMPARAWELGIGALTVFAIDPLRHRGERLARGGLTAASALGLLAVLAPIALYSAATPFPGAAALAPVLGTAILLGAGGLRADHPLARVFSSPGLVRLGGLSYGWYLWHWPLLAIARVANLGATPSVAVRVAIVLGSLALAELSLRFVEAPIRHGRFWRAIPPYRMIAVGAGTSAVVALLASAVPRLENAHLAARFGRPLVEAVLERPEFGTECFARDAIGTAKCDFSFAPAGATAVPRLALWGDSHACAYFPMLTDYARAHGLGASLYCLGDTPPLAPGYLSDAVFADLRRKLDAPGAGPVAVALAARWTLYTDAVPISATTPRGTGSADAVAAGLDRSLTELRRIGVARALVILPGLELPRLTFRCLMKDVDACAVRAEDLERLRGEVTAKIRAVVVRHPFARVIDPTSPLCRDGRCPVVRDGVPAVSDDNHPTVSAARRLGTEITAELDTLARGR